MASLDEVAGPERGVIVVDPRHFGAVLGRLSQVRLHPDKVVPDPAVAQLIRRIRPEHRDVVQLLVGDQVSQDAGWTFDNLVQVFPGKTIESGSQLNNGKTIIRRRTRA